VPIAYNIKFLTQRAFREVALLSKSSKNHSIKCILLNERICVLVIGRKFVAVFIVFGKELVIKMFIVETDVICKGNEHIIEG